MTKPIHSGHRSSGTSIRAGLKVRPAVLGGLVLLMGTVAATQALGGREVAGTVTMEVVQGQMVLRSTAGSLTLVSSGQGILVSDVAGDMASLGLRSGDTIVAVKGRAARVPEDLVAVLRGAEAQEPVAVQVIRNGQSRRIEIRRADWAGALPPEPPTPPPVPGSRP